MRDFEHACWRLFMAVADSLRIPQFLKWINRRLLRWFSDSAMQSFGVSIDYPLGSLGWCREMIVQHIAALERIKELERQNTAGGEKIAVMAIMLDDYRCALNKIARSESLADAADAKAVLDELEVQSDA